MAEWFAYLAAAEAMADADALQDSTSKSSVSNWSHRCSHDEVGGGRGSSMFSRLPLFPNDTIPLPLTGAAGVGAYGKVLLVATLELSEELMLLTSVVSSLTNPVLVLDCDRRPGTLHWPSVDTESRCC
mmetsp:Transcript_23433/g.28795  ORF Transcript_23433/g.28795 Transcript_23433/m.28795 type:complete len:128 (-) Transcript_23433:149-532(-)